MKVALKKLDFLIFYLVASICAASYLRNVMLDVATWIQNFRQEISTTF